MDILADDIVGYWPGDREPVRGFKAYYILSAAIVVENVIRYGPLLV